MSDMPLVYLSHFVIQVNGTALDDDVKNSIVEVMVEDDLSQPAMFMFSLIDPSFAIMDSGTFGIGKEVEILASGHSSRQKTLIKGEITSIEAELASGSSLHIIRGYDLSHRLYRGRRTRTFLNQSDADIMKKILSEASLSADIQSTSGQHKYVIQHNQTDMEFLQERAALLGYRIQTDGKRVSLKQLEETPPQASELKLHNTLHVFRPRISAVAQSNTVEVRGWDPTTKKAIVGQATAPAQPSKIGNKKKPGQLAGQAFQADTTFVITDIPVSTQKEADSVAQAALNELADNAITAEGICEGEPGLRAGMHVSITGVGSQFTGTYFVTATRHLYTRNPPSYETTFWVNGYRANNILHMMNGHQHNGAAPSGSINGMVVGVVSNNNDPDKLGRVKVKFPWLATMAESNWARLLVLGAGPGRGFFLVPEVNDEVLVGFEHGDINRPFVFGGLWNTKDNSPTTTVKDEKVEVRSITTRIGHALQFDDTNNQGGISITTKGGRTIFVNDKDQSIEITSAKHTVLLNDKTGEVKIESGGKMNVKSQQNMTFEGPGGGKMEITPGGIKIGTGSSSLELAAAQIKMTSAQVQVSGSAKLSLAGGAQAELKGGITTIQGGLVKIN